MTLVNAQPASTIQDQIAAADICIHLMDIHAFHAQLDLKPMLKIPNASHWTATVHLKN